MSTHHTIYNFVLLFSFITLGTVAAQRPSYAGSRPQGGLNQKDKYHVTQAQLNPDTNNIESRFGEANNSTAFGVAQRAPVGLPIVMPESSYQPLPPSLSASSSADGAVSFDNRIGGTDGNGTQTQSQAPLPMPLDAHGDRELIAQLSRLPVDQQPFWFLNYQAIEAQRNGTGANFGGPVASRSSFLG